MCKWAIRILFWALVFGDPPWRLGRGDLGSCPSAALVFPRAVRHLRWPLVAGLSAAEIPEVT